MIGLSSEWQKKFSKICTADAQVARRMEGPGLISYFHLLIAHNSVNAFMPSFYILLRFGPRHPDLSQNCTSTCASYFIHTSDPPPCTFWLHSIGNACVNNFSVVICIYVCLNTCHLLWSVCVFLFMVISSDKPVLWTWFKVYQIYHSLGSLHAFKQPRKI
jgi:hypothetical protein